LVSIPPVAERIPVAEREYHIGDVLTIKYVHITNQGCILKESIGVTWELYIAKYQDQDTLHSLHQSPELSQQGFEKQRKE
jgi:hypothetical protein